MNPDDFIEEAIETGARLGVVALDPVQRVVFLISEAETLCDMEGIDTFLDRYSPAWMDETVTAFRIVGAEEIARELQLVLIEGASESRLDLLNEFITSRTGYGYDSIRRMITERQIQ
jgi:hypothetical protein